MKNIFFLVKHNIRLLTQKSLIFTLAFIFIPILISICLSILIPDIKSFNGQVIDNCDSELSKLYIETIASKESINLEGYSDTGNLNLEDKIRMGDISFGLVVSKNFKKAIKAGKYSEAFEFYCIDNDIGMETIEDVIFLEAQRFNILLNKSAAKEDKTKWVEESVKDTVNVVSMNLDGTSSDYSLSNMLFSFLIMFAFMRAMNGSAVISRDKERGIYSRILISSISLEKYFLGNLLSTIIVVAFQSITSIYLITKVTGIEFGCNLAEVSFILLLLSLVSVTLSNFFISITDNKEVSNILSTFVAIFLLMGGIVPVEFLPELASKLSYLIPTRWTIDCLLTLQMGNSLNDCILKIMMMIVFSVLLFLISMNLVKRKDNKI